MRRAEFFTDRDKIFTRYLVSTPWGDLLQVRPILARGQKCPKSVMVKIDKIDVEGRRIIELRPGTALCCVSWPKPFFLFTHQQIPWPKAELYLLH